MLINISGSGDGHWERPPYSADVLSKLHAIGWYKADRRSKRTDCGVYGPLLCLGEFTACPTLQRDYVVPRDVRQYFDPKSATLTTFFSQLDHSTMEKLELRIETCLTSSGVLLQEIEIMEAPARGVGYAFTLGTVSASYQNHMVPLASPESSAVLEGTAADEMILQSQWPELKVCAFSLVGGARMSKASNRTTTGLGFSEHEQTVEPLMTGSRLWRAVSFQDDREGGNPLARCQELIQELRRDGLRIFREKHLIEWEEYFSQSKVELPEPSVQYLYDLSRYVMKANHHPTGFQPVGLLPYQWQGAMFWDAATVMEAFVTSSNVTEAKEICGQIQKLLPEGRVLANRLGNSGARMEWTVNLDSFTPYEPPSRQFHNNAVWAKAFCMLDRYVAEPSGAAAEPAAELLLFLTQEFERHGDSSSLEQAFVGIDESHSDPKPYDTWTCGVLVKALEEYLALCERHGEKSKLPQAELMIETLRKILEANIDEAGILQSFRGGKMPHWGSLVFDMYPKHRAAHATIAAMTRNYDFERDLYNFHGLNRYAERAFPWANYTVARCLAKMGQSESLTYFMHALSHCNYFGGIPERIFYHGENYIEWFSTGHAALVLAMNTMLACEVEGSVKLLGGIDVGIWHNLSFERIHAGEGWVVSLVLHERKIKKCVVENLAKESRLLTLEVPALNLEHSQMAQPGGNVIEFESETPRQKA